METTNDLSRNGVFIFRQIWLNLTNRGAISITIYAAYQGLADQAHPDHKRDLSR